MSDHTTPSTVDRAKEATADTTRTAKEQARQVGDEIRTQAGQAAHQLRGRVRDEADSQTRRAAQNLRQWADDLSGMTESGKPDSPVHGMLQQVAGTGHRAADYLQHRGLTGATGDLQDFARRRPGLFLAGALAAGFLIGRVAKAGTENSTGWGPTGSGPTGTAPVAPGPATTYPTDYTTPAPRQSYPTDYGTPAPTRPGEDPR
ncbi:hypothetical protein [Herbidospora daliensis]|uniref:hypothetical protein n=1 Tax=Herbidospora daliensis TaxID=295585 RepID=UPI000785EE8D|nr:hypothetical protein [Herbidospora daliensis]